MIPFSELYAFLPFSEQYIYDERGAAMSRDWTKDELQAASKAMKAAGHLGYDEFCEYLEKATFTAYCKEVYNNHLIKISVHRFLI